MTCAIKFIDNESKPQKTTVITTVNAAQWKRSIDDYSDTAVIKLPSIALMTRDGDQYSRVDTGLQFKRGMYVEIWAGYDGKNYLRFAGFIRRINFSVPVEIECEGFSYLLRIKHGISASYPAGTTIRKVLQDLVRDTPIVLSSKMPETIIESSFSFDKVSGVDVLDWLKKKTLSTIYFNWNEIYSGIREGEIKSSVNMHLNWNVIKDNELKFNADREYADVRIVLKKKNKDGTTEKVESSVRGDVKEIRLEIPIDKESMKQRLVQAKKEFENTGYEGSLTTFLIPYVEPGMSVKITDSRYKERGGVFYVDTVEGSFSRSGGRQKIKIGNVLSNG